MDLSDLRQAAIAMLEHRPASPEILHQQTPQELIHELRVHQAELEMQNEELRLAQLELENSRDKFANLFDFAPMGYLTLDASNRIVEANLTIAKLLEVERGKLVGQMIGRFVAPQDATRLQSHLSSIAGFESKATCEITMQASSGRRLPVRLDSTSDFDDCRSLAITDLSENAELLRAKRDSDERLRTIYHALPVPVAFVDCAETYQFNNAAHEAWFEVSCQLIIGRSVKEFLGDEIYERVRPYIQRTLAGQGCSCELVLPDGPRAVEVHYAPHRDDLDQVIGFYELMFDVSARRRMEEEQTKRIALKTRLDGLSHRQRSVFDLLMGGCSNKTITLRLDVGMRTVERERHDILQLLGVGSINEMLISFAGIALSDDADELNMTDRA